MRILALSSGTSVDSVDVALAEIGPAADPSTLTLIPLGHLEVPWEEELRHQILAALPPAETGVGQWCDFDAQIGRAFAAAALTGLQQLGPADMVVSHGQTLFHRVVEGRVLGTLQVGQPAWIHTATGLPVISDLRSTDVAAGGHGAPLVSVLDHLWFGDRPTAVLNIGGIANLTLVGTDHVTTGDTGPGNCLIDAAAARTGHACDLGGARAAAGRVDHTALEVLLGDPYYQRPFPRSTGREHFHADYVSQRLEDAGAPTPQGDDLFATLTELTARTIAQAVGPAERLVASGGGARNPTLLRRLAALAGPVSTTTEFGLDADAKEAYLFALLGYLSAHGLPGTAPAAVDEPAGHRATGAPRPMVLGSLTPPAPGPPVDPQHHAETPITSLTIRKPEDTQQRSLDEP